MPDLIRKTCETCRHWTGGYRDQAFDWDTRECMYPRQESGVPRDGFNTKGLVPLVTGPDFGCTHWEHHNG